MLKRIKTIQARVFDEEYDLIEKRADAAGLSISDYLRLVALAAKIDVTTLPDLIPVRSRKGESK